MWHTHSESNKKNLSQPGQNRTRMGNKAKMNRRSARSSKCRQILKLTSSHTEPTKHWQPHNDLLSCRHHDEVCTYLAGSQVFCLQQTNKSCRFLPASFYKESKSENTVLRFISEKVNLVVFGVGVGVFLGVVRLLFLV